MPDKEVRKGWHIILHEVPSERERAVAKIGFEFSPDTNRWEARRFSPKAVLFLIRNCKQMGIHGAAHAVTDPTFKSNGIAPRSRKESESLGDTTE